MTIARSNAIAAINNYKPTGQAWNFRETPTSEIFGSNVFSETVMKDRLPKSVYKAMQATIKQGKPLDSSIADAVALAMKDWAIEKGATHYAHVFYPLTGITAEKHDSFLEPVSDGQTLADSTVTLRDRDTLVQTRVPIDACVELLRERLR